MPTFAVATESTHTSTSFPSLIQHSYQFLQVEGGRLAPSTAADLKPFFQFTPPFFSLTPPTRFDPPCPPSGHPKSSMFTRVYPPFCCNNNGCLIGGEMCWGTPRVARGHHSTPASLLQRVVKKHESGGQRGEGWLRQMHQGGNCKTVAGMPRARSSIMHTNGDSLQA